MRGVYVHFPYCLKKCPYCDFLSVAKPRAEIDHVRYADAVIAELERRASWAEQTALRSVFFGGGTPSLWDPQQLGRVLASIRSTMRAAAELEVTVECNPTSFDAQRAERLLSVGANRVSIGVQGLDSDRLEFLGRLHDPQGGLEAVRAAIQAGVPRVSADLIHGVHGESAEQAVAEVTAVAELGVTHLSAYTLTIEPGTQFGALAKRGRLPLLDEDRVAQSFAAVAERLRALGFEHYEISNFSREGHYAQHNLGYWRGADYLGLGCGAFGTVHVAGGAGEPVRRLRYRNTPSPERYLSALGEWPELDLELATPGGAVSELEWITSEMELSERLMLGLRLSEGVDFDELARELGLDIMTRGRALALDRLVQRGRVQRDGSRIWIPEAQRLFADGSIAELL